MFEVVSAVNTRESLLILFDLGGFLVLVLVLVLVPRLKSKLK